VKTLLPSTSLLTLMCCAILATTPAKAGDIYNNGPINGSSDAWTINFGFVTSDTFTVSGGNSTITGLAFGAWLFPGDTALSVELSITQFEFGGTTYFDQVINLTQTGCTINQYGYNVCTETGVFNGPTLGNGMYWINLQNGVVSNGDPLYWDENDGVGCTSPGCPSMASNNSVGSLGSEAFTIMGNTAGTVPEPGSLALFATGVVGLAAVLRRKLL
jgi:hypothetical protein